MRQQKGDAEERSDDPRFRGEFTAFPGGEGHDDMGEHSEGDTESNIAGERDNRESHERWDRDFHIAKIKVLNGSEHRHADVDEARGDGAGRNQLDERGQKDRGEEEEAGEDGRKTSLPPSVTPAPDSR